MKKKSSRKTISFGNAVRLLRAEKGLTQNNLAELISDTADAPWVSRVEGDKKDISLKTAIRIAGALGASLYLNDYKIGLE